MAENTTKIIFRTEAVQRYMQSKDKNVLPRFISATTFKVLWLMMATFIGITALVLLTNVPTYAHGSGLVTNIGSSERIAVIFLPADKLTRLKPGKQVDVTAGSTKFSTQISTVNPNILTPAKAREVYGTYGAFLVTQPTATATILLDTAIPGITSGTVLTIQTIDDESSIFVESPFLRNILGGGNK